MKRYYSTRFDSDRTYSTDHKYSPWESYYREKAYKEEHSPALIRLRREEEARIDRQIAHLATKTGRENP